MSVVLGLALSDDVVKAGFERGPAAQHKYWKRVRIMTSKGPQWKYYYRTEADKKRWMEDRAAALEAKRAKLTAQVSIGDEHGHAAEFEADHPQLIADRKELTELTEEYLQEMLKWEKPPALKVSDRVKQEFHNAALESADPTGKPMSPMRALEMAFAQLPPSIKEHFSGALEELAIVGSGEDKKMGDDDIGYCDRPGVKGGPSKIAIEFEFASQLAKNRGAHMFGGLLPVEVIVHEMAHAIHNQLGANGSGKNNSAPHKGRYSPNKTWPGPNYHDWLDFLDKDQGISERGVTGYAEFNDKERWAESFSAALLFPQQLALVAPQTYEFFRRFFGEKNLRPIHTDRKLVAELGAERDKAITDKNEQRALELKAEIDQNIGVLDMDREDPRLQWWAPLQTKVQRLLAEDHVRQQNMANDYMDRNGRDYPDDKFYEMSVGGRTVYMRVGRASDDTEFSGWTPTHPGAGDVDLKAATGRYQLRIEEIKELYDADGTPLTNETARWYLEQDRLTDEAPAGEDKNWKPSAVTDFTMGRGIPGTENYKAIDSMRLNKWLGDIAYAHARKSSLEAQLVEAKTDKQQDAVRGKLSELESRVGTITPIELDHETFRVRSGTFGYDRWDRAGAYEIERLSSPSLSSAERKQLEEELLRKNPGVKRNSRGQVVKAQRRAGEAPVPVFHTIRYLNDNPDGTKTLIECTQGEDGNYYVKSPVWRQLLTPNGEHIRSADHLRQLSMAAARDRRRTWVSIKTDASGSDTEHFYHIEVQFDGRGQPRILGDEWKRRLGKDKPRIDDLLSGGGSVFEKDRPKIKADKIRLKKAATRKVDLTPPKQLPTGEILTGPPVIMSVGREEVGRLMADPPTWDSMPSMAKGADGKIPLRPELPPDLNGKPQRLTHRERKLIKQGLLPSWFQGTIKQREWVRFHFQPVYEAWERSKNIEIAAVLTRVIPAKRAGEVPSPPGWDRMPPGYESMPAAAEEKGRKLTIRERNWKKEGLLPKHYKGTETQRAWLQSSFEPAFKEWEDTKDDLTAQALPEQYIFTAAQGSGFPGKQIRRMGAAAAKRDTRPTFTGRQPEALQNDLLVYEHKEFHPVSGKVIASEIRVLLPKDGSITPDHLSRLPGVDIGYIDTDGKKKRKPPGELVIALDMTGFHRVRGHLGAVSLTTDAEKRLRSQADTLREAARRQAKEEHVIEIGDLDPEKLHNGEVDGFGRVGLRSHMPNGAKFTLAHHQQELVQLTVDNGGRSLGAHYMGCVSGDTEIDINRSGKRIRVRIADAYERTHGGRHAPPPSPTSAWGMVEGRVGLIRVDTIWASGVKTTYRLATLQGRAIRTTAEHKFWTGADWKQHDQLAIGDRIAIDWLGDVIYDQVTQSMIEPRDEMTYDMTMQPETPSYIANGIVVHNTGKTISAIVTAKLLMAMTDPADPTKPHPNAPKKTLIVVPLNTVEQWRAACFDFDDGCTVVGADKSHVPVDKYLENVAKGLDSNDIVIVGPEYFTINQDKLRKAGFDGLIVDEAHMGIKNEASERNKVVQQWNPDMKLLQLLTGTPITVSPSDILQYIQILSKGEQWAGMTKAQFEFEYLEDSPIPGLTGASKKVRVQIKPAKRAELAAIIAQWTHVAMPKDVRGKALPATRIEENRHAHMTGTQALLYGLYMAAVSDGDMAKLSGGVLSSDELSEETARSVAIAKAVSNCVGYKPKSNDKYIQTAREEVGRGGKIVMKPTVWTTFDPKKLMNRTDIRDAKTRMKLAGRWPAMGDPIMGGGDAAKHTAGLYGIMFRELFPNGYEAVAGKRITPEQLAAMKRLGWPNNVANPDYGPVGIRCRGSDTPNLDPEYRARVNDALTFQREWADALRNGFQDGRGQWVSLKSPEQRDQFLADFASAYGISPGLAEDYLATRPNDTIHSTKAAYGGVTVQEGETWFSDDKGSLHLLYHPDDWDLDADGPKGGRFGEFDVIDHHSRVRVANKYAPKPPAPPPPPPDWEGTKAQWKKKFRDEWVSPSLSYDHEAGGGPNGALAIRRDDTQAIMWVPRDSIAVLVKSLMDPGYRTDKTGNRISLRGERRKCDVAMTVGNAKAEELRDYIQNFHMTTENGRGHAEGRHGARQMVMFANGILDGCRTMEATLRTMGFKDVNEALEGSVQYDPDDPHPGNGKYFVTYIGATYTGERDLNAEIFKKMKDTRGRDLEQSLFVNKCLKGRDWRAWPTAEAHSTVKLSQWLPEQRSQIKAQFKIDVPEAHYEEKIDVPEAHVVTKYFYGSTETVKVGGETFRGSEALLREMTLIGNPDKMFGPAGDPAAIEDPKVAEAALRETERVRAQARAKLTALQNAFTDLVKKHATANGPLSQSQQTVFNNCEMIICSDAAQVGLNFGNAVEMVNYDSLGSPMKEWQRITRSARMLPPAIEKEIAPIVEKLKAAETEIFRPAELAAPSGVVLGLEVAGKDIGDLPFGDALTHIANWAQDGAANAKDAREGHAWTRIMNRALTSANLGTTAAVAFFEEMKETQIPGQKGNVLGLHDMRYEDPMAGTYDIRNELHIDEPSRAVTNAIDSLLDESEKEQLIKAGFTKEGGKGIDASALYLAIRAQQVMDKITSVRDKVSAEMRAARAGEVVQDADVTNAIIDSLSPGDRAVLKNQKYLVNVRRMGVSAHVPQMVKVGEGDDAAPVFAGYAREHPIVPEQNVRATGRARMSAVETVLKAIQEKIPIRTELDYETTNAAEIGNMSALHLEKSLQIGFTLGRRH
jgi:hypothetical protein